MAPPHPNTSSDSRSPPEVSALISNHQLSTNRRMEIDEDPNLKLHLKEWGAQLKEDLLKIETYRNRCNATRAELYQLMSFYILSQGVVLGAFSIGRKRTCRISLFPASFSFLTSVATAFSVHSKLGEYEIEKWKFTMAERLAKNEMGRERLNFPNEPILGGRWQSLRQAGQAGASPQFQYKNEDLLRVGGYPAGRGEIPKELLRVRFCVSARTGILTFRPPISCTAHISLTCSLAVNRAPES